MGVLLCVFVSVISLSSRLLLVPFFFPPLFFFFWFDLIFPFVPWSHSIFVLPGLFTLPEENVSTLPFRSPGLLCSVPRSPAPWPLLPPQPQEHGE